MKAQVLQDEVDIMLLKGAIHIVLDYIPSFYSRIILAEKASDRCFPSEQLCPVDKVQDGDLKHQYYPSSRTERCLLPECSLSGLETISEVHQKRDYLSVQGCMPPGLFTAPQVFTRVFTLVSVWDHQRGTLVSVWYHQRGTLVSVWNHQRGTLVSVWNHQRGSHL